LITGFVIGFISSYIGGNTEQMQFQSPDTYLGWAILTLSCFSSAYLEESFFRFYLLTRKEDLNLNAASAVAISVILFSVCHIYEGPWGFLNSVISAVILAFLFLRYRSLHGVAIAHGLYNIAVYIINAQLMQSVS
jgi:membrane protease YdiL (CAAX protease family)